MLKKIFLPLENSPYTIAAIDYACFIANRQDAEVTGGIFMDMEKVNASLGKLNPGHSISWFDHINDEAISHAKPTVEYLMHTLKDKCEKQNVKFSFEDEIGMPSSRITNLSNYYDLIITGLKSDFGLVKKNFGISFLQKILEGSAIPVLAVPNYFRNIHNIIIAYDASLTAARALQRFVHIANFADQNIIIVTSSKDSAWAEDNVKRAKDYLLSYGAQNVATDYTQMEIIKVLQSSYYDFADLIVMGSHSQNIVKDIFIGSVTQKFITDAKKPLFIGI
jgi:nucleotide-binding universal stress UspA family protein